MTTPVRTGRRDTPQDVQIGAHTLSLLQWVQAPGLVQPKADDNTRYEEPATTK